MRTLAGPSAGGAPAARRPRVAQLARLLDRPDAVLAVVPAGALYVGVVQLVTSDGPRGGAGLVGFCLVALVYLAQLVAVLVSPRLSRSAWAVPTIASSPFSSVFYSAFLVDPMPPAAWTWLIPPVLMVACYLCTVRDLLVVAVFSVLSGVAFFTSSGYDLSGGGPVVVLLALECAWAGVLTRWVLGNLRQAGEAVQERTSRDPLTGVLNGTGLDDAFGRLLERMARTERGARHAPDDVISLLVVRIDDLKRVSDHEGNLAVDRVLVRTADALTKAYRRDHLVARLRGDTFVVVTTQPVDQLAAVLAAEVRRVNLDRGLTASIGGVERVWARDMSVDRLGGLILLAEGCLEEATRAGGDTLRLTPFDRTQPLPGPANVPLPDLELRSEDSKEALSTAETSVFGVGLTTMALLAASVQTRRDIGDLNTLLLALLAALAVTGVLVAVGWLRGVWVHALAVVGATVGCVLTVVTAARPLPMLASLPLLPAPFLLASLSLPMGVAAWLVPLLPLGIWYGLGNSGMTPHLALVTGLDMLGFVLVTSGLALWVRRIRDITNRQLLRIATTDAVTGLLSREGLVEHYRALPEGEEIALVFLDVDDMASVNEAVGTHGGDTVLRRLGAVLLDLVAPDGAAARVGGDEFVLLLPGPGRSAGIMRRLGEQLAVDDVPLSLSVGQAYGRTDGDGTLWRLMAHADEALLLNRALKRRTGQGRVPAAPPATLAPPATPPTVDGRAG